MAIPPKKPGFGSEPDKNQTPAQKIEELIHRVDPLIEQVNNLYNQFATGVERLAPAEKRKQLQAMIDQLQAVPKTNSTYRFRVQTIIGRFNTMAERWDRMLRDIESGKIKRIVGPNKG
jgi:hypothetical protein